MILPVALMGLAAALVTTLGGLFALRLKDRLHLILGFSAGAVIGVAFFDLIPEALELAAPFGASATTTAVALGFTLYLVLDRMIVLHLHHGEGHDHAHGRRGAWGAATLATHSFLDGLGIGLAFQVSAAVGAVVAAAVLAHDFSDGINTVSMIARDDGSRTRALRWLALVALAPSIGVLASLLFTASGPQFGMLLALFAGFFLYIGASDLLPESHHAHPAGWTTIATILGMGVIYLAVQLAGA